MIVHKNSWHYKLNDYFGIVESHQTLCSYFWATVAHIGLIFIVASALFAVANLLGMFAVDILSCMDYANTLSAGMQLLLYTLSGIGFIIVAIIVVCILIGAYAYFKHKMPKRSDSKPSVFIEYVKAKKRKICPLITFKD